MTATVARMLSTAASRQTPGFRVRAGNAVDQLGHGDRRDGVVLRCPSRTLFTRAVGALGNLASGRFRLENDSMTPAHDAPCCVARLSVRAPAFQAQASETADVSPAIETVFSRNYLSILSSDPKW